MYRVYGKHCRFSISIPSPSLQTCFIVIASFFFVQNTQPSFFFNVYTYFEHFYHTFTTYFYHTLLTLLLKYTFFRFNSYSLSDPQGVAYQPIMSHFFSDIDGRSKYAVMGTPGADISEFLLCILAYESSSIKTTRADTGQVYQMMSQFLKDMVRVKKKSKKSL